MGYDLVKSGSVSTPSATAAPSFGQATASGNLIVACVQANTAGTITTTGVGYTSQQASGNGCTVAIFYKPNCSASEAAPTFACVGATSVSAQLAEFSGGATSSPQDQTGNRTGKTSSQSATAGAADAASGELLIAAGAWVVTLASQTISNSFNNGTANSLGTYTAATGLNVGNGYSVTTGNGSADSWTQSSSLANNKISGTTLLIASFKGAAVDVSTAGAVSAGTLAAVAGTTAVTVPGTVAASTVAGPAGSLSAGITVAGAAATSTLAGRAGTVAGAAGGPNSTQSLSALAGGGGITVSGVLASSALTAFPGTPGTGAASVAGALATSTLAGLAGGVGSGAGSAASSLSTAGLSGSLLAGASVTGVTAADALYAPAGVPGVAATVAGARASATLAGVAGTVAQTALVAAPPAAVVLAARAGTLKLGYGGNVIRPAQPTQTLTAIPGRVTGYISGLSLILADTEPNNNGQASPSDYEPPTSSATGSDH